MSAEERTRELAVVVAALQAGRIDGKQAVASAAALVEQWIAEAEQAMWNGKRRDALIQQARAEAWDEGEQAGRDNADDGYPDPLVENPYRAALASEEPTP